MTTRRSWIGHNGMEMGRDGWMRGTTDGHAWIAKVYDEGSTWGINEGRVSKLTVYATDRKSAEIYNYDRGLDFDNAPAGLVDQILGQIG